MLPREMAPPGLITLAGTGHDRPALPDAEIALYRARGLTRAADLLADHIEQLLEAQTAGSLRVA